MLKKIPESADSFFFNKAMSNTVTNDGEWILLSVHKSHLRDNSACLQL